MQHDKKQLEVLLIQYFRENYIDFPKGKLKPSESPDFIVQMKSKHFLGIELTRLTPTVVDYHDENNLAHISIREEIVVLSRDLFEQNSDLRLFVKFLFSEIKLIPTGSQISVAVQVVNLIRKAVENKNADAFFKETIPNAKLPIGLESILIINHPAMTDSIWERANNFGVSFDVMSDLQRVIQKKDEKLRIYHRQQLNYYWLLVTTDRLRGIKNFNLPESIMNHTFKSRFQKVFLFDLIKARIFELE